MRPRLLLALLLALAAPLLRGQNAPPSLERIGLTLLTSADIRRELKLSKEVSAQVEAEFKAYVEKAQSLFRGKNTQAEQQAALAELRKVQDGTAARILAKLTPAQRLRLRQLTLQSQSVLLILHPEVVKELGLTSAQITKLKEIREKAEAKVRELEMRRRSQLDAVPKPKQGAGQKEVQDYNQRLQAEIQSFAAADQKQIQAWSRETEQASLAVLTPTQRKKWDQMLGPKFRRPGTKP
ncbi:MAG: hypothetical protein WHU10_06560 [Fimbriimonadales bacterium]